MEILLLALLFVLVAYAVVQTSTLAYDLVTGRYKRLYGSTKAVKDLHTDAEPHSQ